MSQQEVKQEAEVSAKGLSALRGALQRLAGVPSNLEPPKALGSTMSWEQRWDQSGGGKWGESLG